MTSREDGKESGHVRSLPLRAKYRHLGPQFWRHGSADAIPPSLLQSLHVHAKELQTKLLMRMSKNPCKTQEEHVPRTAKVLGEQCRLHMKSLQTPSHILTSLKPNWHPLRSF